MLRSFAGPKYLAIVILVIIQFFSAPFDLMANVTPFTPKILSVGAGHQWRTNQPHPDLKPRSLKALKAKLARLITSISAPDEFTVRRANRQAKFGFVLTLLGLLVIPVLPAMPGIILCIAALSEEKKAPGTLSKNSKAFAQVGIVLGVLSIIILALILVIIAGLTYR